MKNLANFGSTRHVFIVDALRYTLLLEQKAFTSMCRALRRIENNDDGTGHPNRALTLTAISAAWNIVDTVHRLRGLVRQIPELSQRDPEVQLFIHSTSLIEDFRNIYQHLNVSIPRIEGKTNPVMGVLSWITNDPMKSITIFVGTSTPDTEFHTVTFDRLKREFVQRFLFSVGNKDIDLDEIHSSCKKLRKFFEAWLTQNGHLSAEEASVGVVRFQFQIVQPT